MKTKPVLAIFLFLAGVLLLWLQIPVAASPVQQVAFPSPTPVPDGRIIYKVKAGETVSGVAPRAYIGNYKALTIPPDAFGLNGNGRHLTEIGG